MAAETPKDEFGRCAVCKAVLTQRGEVIGRHLSTCSEAGSARWLDLLAKPDTVPSLREEAVRRLTTTLIEKDVEIAALVKDLEQLRDSNQKHREFASTTSNALIRLMGGKASPIVLTVVRPEGG